MAREKGRAGLCCSIALALLSNPEAKGKERKGKETKGRRRGCSALEWGFL
jgi:hypothetical protein